MCQGDDICEVENKGNCLMLLKAFSNWTHLDGWVVGGGGYVKGSMKKKSVALELIALIKCFIFWYPNLGAGPERLTHVR